MTGTHDASVGDQAICINDAAQCLHQEDGQALCAATRAMVWGSSSFTGCVEAPLNRLRFELPPRSLALVVAKSAFAWFDLRNTYPRARNG